MIMVNNGTLYLLSMKIGNWDEDSEWYQLIISENKSKLEQISKELFDSVCAGYEKTVQFFNKYNIDTKYLDLEESSFNEFFRGSKFTTTVEQFKHNDGLYIIQ